MAQRHGDFAICAVAAMVSGKKLTARCRRSGGKADGARMVRRWTRVGSTTRSTNLAWDLGGSGRFHASAVYRRDWCGASAAK